MHIVVIGAGVIGAAIAERLAVRGTTVTILEKRAPGRGASQASAGILAPYTEAHQSSPLLALGVRSLALYDDFIAGVVERSGRTVEYARTGTFEVAFSDAERDPLRQLSAWLAEQNIAHEWAGADHARVLEPAIGPEVIGGLFVATHGFVNVRQLVVALLQSARFHGTVLEAGVEPREIVPHRDHVEIAAADRRWHADAVVVATGSWSRSVRIRNAPAASVRPVRGQLLHLRWRDANVPRRVLWGPDCYIVPSSDGSVLVGATVEDAGFDEAATVSGVLDLATAAVRMAPAAREASLEGVRVGLRPQGGGPLPIVGPFPGMPRVTIATGHYRNGILLAPLTAELVASYVLDGIQDAALAMMAPGLRARLGRG
jgi:glycine oxidase